LINKGNTIPRLDKYDFSIRPWVSEDAVVSVYDHPLWKDHFAGEYIIAFYSNVKASITITVTFENQKMVVIEDGIS